MDATMRSTGVPMMTATTDMQERDSAHHDAILEFGPELRLL